MKILIIVLLSFIVPGFASTLSNATELHESSDLNSVSISNSLQVNKKGSNEINVSNGFEQGSLLKRFYGSLYYSRISTDKIDGQLKNRSSPTNPGYGLALGYYVTPYVSIEGEYLSYFGQYMSTSGIAPPGNFGEKVELGVEGISLIAKYSSPLGRYHPFIGCGVGLYDADFALENYDEPGYFSEYDFTTVAEDNSIMGYQLLTGVGINIKGRHKLEVGYRKIFLEADFGQYSGGRINIGGDMIWLGYKFGGL